MRQNGEIRARRLQQYLWARCGCCVYRRRAAETGKAKEEKATTDRLRLQTNMQREERSARLSGHVPTDAALKRPVRYMLVGQKHTGALVFHE